MGQWPQLSFAERQRLAQANGPKKLAAVVFRAPYIFQAGVAYDDRRPPHEAGRREPLLQGRGLDQGLDIRSGLANGRAMS